MGDNFEKTNTILQGVKGPTATAIKALAMDLDNKFVELEKRNEERHKAIMSAFEDSKKATENKICELERSTNERFSKLKVVMFFAEHWKLLLIVLIAALIVFGIIRPESGFEFFRTFK